MFESRVRNYSHVASITGSRQNPIDSGFQTRLSGEECETTDIVGNLNGNNPFHLVRKIRGTVTLDGKWPVGGSHTWFMNAYPIDYSLGAHDPRDRLNEPSSLDLAGWHTMLASRTNPSRPHINMPAFLGELRDIKDIPNIVKQWGQSNFIGKAASAHITNSFVVKPMISDISKMLEFQSSVDKRVKELEKIRDTGKSSARATILEDLIQVPYGNLVVHSTYEVIYAYLERTYTRKVWGTARWHPLNPSSLPKGNADLRKKTRRILSGFSANGISAAAWELLPWSWLADYFVGIGDLIGAKQNAFELEMRGSCIMVQDTCLENFSLLPGSWNTWLTASPSSWSTSWIEKRRYPISDFAPFIPPRKPLLSFRQMSILGSLAALKSGIGKRGSS